MENAFEKKGTSGTTYITTSKRGFWLLRRRNRSAMPKGRDSRTSHGTPSPIRISSHINLTTLFSKPRVIGRESGASFVSPPLWHQNFFPEKDLSVKGLLITERETRRPECQLLRPLFTSSSGPIALPFLPILLSPFNVYLYATN